MFLGQAIYVLGPLQLAIFPEDTDVPLRMIELLWGLDDLDTQQTVELLANYGLVDLDLREGLVRLHDEIHSFLQRAISDETAVLHGRLLDRLGNPKQIQDGYALRWLAWHLDKAGRHAELRTLLLDFEWMMAKLEKADIHSLLADYGYSANEPCLHLLQELAAQHAERERVVRRANLLTCAVNVKRQFLAQVTEPQVFVSAS